MTPEELRPEARCHPKPGVVTNGLSGGVDRESGALVFAGAAEAVERLADDLAGGAGLEVPLTPLRDRPAVDPLDGLHVALADDAASASLTIDGTQATLNANRAQLGALAGELRAFVEHNDVAAPGMHHHTELGPVSLIVTGPVDDDTTVEWYSAMLRVTTLIADRAVGVWGTVVLFRATGWDHAHVRALELGRAAEQTYENGDGETVRQIFTRVETLDLLGAELEDGREVYSEHLDDTARARRELEGGPEAWEPTRTGV